MPAVSVKKLIASLTLGSTIILSLSQPAAAQELATTASVYMYSQSGNYIGQALGQQQVEWVHGVDGIFETSANYDNNPTASISPTTTGACGIFSLRRLLTVQQPTLTTDRCW
jgi:hypothetical protein